MGRVSRIARRWARPARRRGALGRGGSLGVSLPVRGRRSRVGRPSRPSRPSRPGRPSPGPPSGRRPFGRPSPRPPRPPGPPGPSRRSGRSPRSLRLPDPPRPFGARWEVTSASSAGGRATSSSRSGSWRVVRPGITWVISLPSNPVSISTLSTSPTVEPAGSVAASTTPLGWRAPAARQVKVRSSRALVSSMSIRRDIGMRPYRLAPGALAAWARTRDDPGHESRVVPSCCGRATGSAGLVVEAGQ